MPARLIWKGVERDSVGQARREATWWDADGEALAVAAIN
jgi:hypothetical protein